MTERSYQEARKIMASANYRRGIITKRKGDVGKWTKIEASYRDQLKHGQADGAKKMLDKAMERLKEAREKFAELKFPESNLPDLPKENAQCENCGNVVPKGETYCKDCLNQ